MNPLMFLLGQQAAADAGVQYDGEIPVTANRTKSLSPEDNPNIATRLIGNTNAVQAAQQAVDKGQEVSERKGMFGIKGTLRDILGLVGDTFLIGSGANPIYMPRRDQERLGDAAAGYTEDPRAAAERLAQLPGGLQIGRDLLEEAQNSDLKKAQLESLTATREDLAASRRASRYDKARPALTALFNKPGAYLEDGSVNPRAKAMAETIANRYGFNLQDFIEEGMTGEDYKLFAGTGTNTYQQETLEDRERQMDQADFRNQTSRISATRPRAAPRPRAEGPDERYTRISNTPADKRSVGDQDWYETERRIRIKKGESARGRRGGSSTPAAKPKPSVSNW